MIETSGEDKLNELRQTGAEGTEMRIGKLLVADFTVSVLDYTDLRNALAKLTSSYLPSHSANGIQPEF